MKPELVTSFRRVDADTFAGVVFDSQEPHLGFAIDILVDGVPCASARTSGRTGERPDGPETAQDFVVTMPDRALRDARTIQARLANLDIAVGPTIDLRASFDDRDPPMPLGEARWQGGLRVTGWITPDRADELCVLVDGIVVDHVRPAAWRQVEIGEGQFGPVRGFDCHLPAGFADGELHRCAVLTARGEELAGSPFAILAFADGLRAASVGRGVAERDLLRADLFDRLVPSSVPFSDYEQWRSREADRPPPSFDGRCAIVLVGPHANAETMECLQGQSHENWVAVSLPQLSGPTSFDPASLRRMLDEQGQDCSIVLFALAGTLLHPSALAEIADALNRADGAEAVYTDVEIRGDDGALWPLAFPAFDYERMLEQGYCALVFALRRAAVERSLQAGATTLFRLFNAVLDDGPAQHGRILHLPGTRATLPRMAWSAADGELAQAGIAHLLRRGLHATADPARATLLPAVRIARSYPVPGVTIIVPSRDRLDLLSPCLDSIRPAIRKHQAELVIVDNGSIEPATLDFLESLGGSGAEIERVAGPFNFSRLINRGARRARAEMLCLLNNDVMALDDGWLEELLNRSIEDDVGATAPLLIHPSGVIQHAGLVLGPGFEVAHAFDDRLDGDPGYADMLGVAHETSAVTAACLLTRKRDFDAVGGFDERNFSINFNDVDYCLKLRQSGRRIVVTPHAKLVHAEGSSRGRRWSADRNALFESERRRLRLKWGAALTDDPFYSPMLSLEPQPYSGLAAPRRPMRARTNLLPPARECPDGF